MNQQLIDKLLHKAGAYFGAEGTDYSGFSSSKFAELILMDVMSICEELGDKGQDGHYCVDAIRRKYFGVEE